MSKNKTIHPQIGTKNLPEGLTHTSVTFTRRSAIAADPKNGIKAAPAEKMTDNVVQIVENAEGIKAYSELLEKHHGGDGITRLAQHVNENLRKRATAAARGCDTEAEARKLLNRGIFAASTGPSAAKQQVKTFEAFQSAYLSENGEAPGPLEISKFYAELAKAVA